jgi:CBS domain-containing protein
MQVSEIMSRDVEFVAPDATVQAAAALMGELDVGALPVGAADDLQGVLTDRDILFRVVAQGRAPSEIRVREVMSRTVFSCRDTDELSVALDLMGAYHVRRLPVTDAGRRVVGWLTLSDVSAKVLLESEAVSKALAGLAAPADAA